MRRPAILIMAGIASGILASYLWRPSIVLCAGCFFLTYFLSERARDEKKRAVMLLLVVFLLIGNVSMFAASIERDPLESGLRKLQAEAMKGTDEKTGRGSGLSPETGIKLSGTVLSCEKNDDEKYRFELKTDEGPRVLVTAYGRVRDCSGLPGHEVLVSGKLSLPSGRRNPKCFDYSLYLRTKKINTVMSADASQMSVGRIRRPVLRALSILRGGFQETLAEYAGEKNAGTASAMLFGDRSGLDEEDYEKFQRNGTAHVLAVSGLHVGIVYAFISGIIGGRRKMTSNIIILAILFFYAALAGFSPSVMRAVTMIALHVFSTIKNYRYDLMSAGAVSASAMLLADPYELFSLGFQMSYLAVFTMGLLIPIFSGIRPRELTDRHALETFVSKRLLPILAIQVGMAPFTAYVFNYFSVSAFIANLPVVFLAGIVIPCGLIAMAVYVCMPPLMPFMSFVLGKLTQVMSSVNEFFYFDGRSSFDVVSPPLLLICLYYGLLFFGGSEMCRVFLSRNDKNALVKAIAAVMIVSLLICVGFADSFSGADVVFVDVGQGSCTLFNAGRGCHIMIDGGGKPAFGGVGGYDVGKKTVKPFLLKNGIRKIDLAVVSHLDADHYAGIASLCREGMVEKLGINISKKDVIGKILKETKMCPEDVIYLRLGDKINVGKTSLDVIGPVSDTEDENESCLVIKAAMGGVSILTDGDIPCDVEQGLIDYHAGTDALKSDVMCAPHHGSKYSSSDAFIETVDPEICVFPTGKNNYGHPDPDVVRKYIGYGAVICRTDRQGAIALYGLTRGRPGVKYMLP